MDSVVCVFIVQTEELIKALQDLENAASGDATVRQKIASLPQEVQDVSLLEKITGERVELGWKVREEGHISEASSPRTCLCLEITDVCAVWVLQNSKAVEIVQALIVILGTMQKCRPATTRSTPKSGLLKTQGRLCVWCGGQERRY